ncbi:hypothetical protein V3664_23810 [Streptomyces sp. CS62]
MGAGEGPHRNPATGSTPQTRVRAAGCRPAADRAGASAPNGGTYVVAFGRCLR